MHNQHLMNNWLHEDDEVDLTNLIDLMVMLCAVLMILLPTYAVYSTQLVAAKGGNCSTPGRNTEILTFGKENELKWNNQPITLEDLDSRIGALKQRSQEPVVQLAGDKGSSYGFSLRLRARLVRQGVKVEELANWTEDN